MLDDGYKMSKRINSVEVSMNYNKKGFYIYTFQAQELFVSPFLKQLKPILY